MIKSAAIRIRVLYRYLCRAAKKAEEELKKQTTSKFADLNEGLRRATEAFTKQIEKKREVEAILSGYFLH